MHRGELRVFYCGEGINTDLDEELRNVLRKYGYENWASGIDADVNAEGIRELAFDLTERCDRDD